MGPIQNGVSPKLVKLKMASHLNWANSNGVSLKFKMVSPLNWQNSKWRLTKTSVIMTDLCLHLLHLPGQAAGDGLPGPGGGRGATPTTSALFNVNIIDYSAATRVFAQ